MITFKICTILFFQKLYGIGDSGRARSKELARHDSIFIWVKNK